ncbi:MAG: nitrogen fixation protein NifX [Methylococcales bacterium]
MSQSTLSRELALRIGLAARALPGTTPKLFIAILRTCIYGPLSEDSVTTLAYQQLRQALINFDINADAEAIQQCLQLLRNPSAPASAAPDANSVLPGSVRVAVGCDETAQIISHFGNCSQFLIYEVSGHQSRLVDTRSISAAAEKQAEDRNNYRAQLIADCKVLYIASVGGPAAAKIVKHGIHPIKIDSADPIAHIINQLQTVLAGTPPPWLAKLMGLAPRSRVCLEQEEA